MGYLSIVTICHNYLPQFYHNQNGKTRYFGVKKVICQTIQTLQKSTITPVNTRVFGVFIDMVKSLDTNRDNYTINIKFSLKNKAFQMLLNFIYHNFYHN